MADKSEGEAETTETSETAKGKAKKGKKDKPPPTPAAKFDLLTEKTVYTMNVRGVDFKMFAFHAPDPYVRLGVTIMGLTSAAGPKPASLKGMRALIDARVNKGILPKDVGEGMKAKMLDNQQKSLNEAKAKGDEEGVKKITEMAEGGVDESRTVFARHPETGVLSIETRSIKAMIRECIQLGGASRKWPGTNPIEYFKHTTDILSPDGNFGLVPFQRDGKLIVAADDIATDLQKPVMSREAMELGEGMSELEGGDEKDRIELVHTRDSMGGRIDGISLFECIHPPWCLSFIIEISNEFNKLTLDMLVDMMRLIPTIHIAAKRRMGYGKAVMKLLSEPSKEPMYYK